jgi:hypothetical protein
MVCVMQNLSFVTEVVVSRSESNGSADPGLGDTTLTVALFLRVHETGCSVPGSKSG